MLFKNIHKACISSVLLTLIALFNNAFAGKIQYKERSLGPTGLFGITSPDKIVIQKVEEGSPAHGIITKNQIITGVNGIPLNGEVRKQWAQAVDFAQSQVGGGKLILNLSDGSSTTINLPVIGSWSPTAPMNCAKSDKIVQETADYMIRNKDIGRYGLGLLALMSTGEKKHLDFVEVELKKLSWSRGITDAIKIGGNWQLAFRTMVLAEYYALTKDADILTALEGYAQAVAESQTDGGLWGHYLPTNGRASVYGAMNSASLQCLLALCLAEKAGISNPAVIAAKNKAYNIYNTFINIGGLAYNNNFGPSLRGLTHNGMSGVIAVIFALEGNLEGAKFYSRSTTAGSLTIENGHTGHYFNQFWTGLGSNIGGDKASSAFFKETNWLHVMNRRWDNNFTYDHSEHDKPEYSYRGLSLPGCHLINFCRHRRALLVTGRSLNSRTLLTQDEVSEAITAGRLIINDSLTTPQLLELLKSPLVDIRERSASILNQRRNAPTNTVEQMFFNGDWNTRLGIYRILPLQINPAPSNQLLDAMAEIVTDTSIALSYRTTTAATLARIHHHSPTHRDIIHNFYLTDHPQDPERIYDITVGSIMPSGRGWPSSNEELAKSIELINKMLTSPYDYVRSNGARWIKQIPMARFHETSAKLIEVANDRRSDYTNHAKLWAVTSAMAAMAEHNIEDGLHLMVNIYNNSISSHKNRFEHAKEVLLAYGPKAKKHIPWLRKVFAEQPRLHGILDDIENSNSQTQPLITMNEYILKSLHNQGDISYQNWQNAYFNTKLRNFNPNNKNNDPDNDGVTNIVEFALGTDPNTQSKVPLEISETNNKVSLKLERPSGIAGITYSIEVSDNLIDWTPLPLQQAVTPKGTTIESGETQTANNNKMFSRVKISEQ